MSGDAREELRILVRRARMLAAAEREAGVIDLVGTPAPAADPAPAPIAATRAPEPVRAPPAPLRAATTAPAAAIPAADAPAARPPVPRVRRPPPPVTHRPLVRALDLPADVLAPFGTLPADVAACTRCDLCATSTRTVFGEGTPTSRLVFCGEAPGADEDETGRPFVGASGELLTAMIEKGLRMRREDVFILNAIKCRPPGNRTPTPAELAACRPFLERQLAVLRPAVIVALGNPASRALLGDVPGIMKIRGRVFEGFGAKIVPTFHPAYVLRTEGSKRDVWNDLQTVMRLLSAASGA